MYQIQPGCVLKYYWNIGISKSCLAVFAQYSGSGKRPNGPQSLKYLSGTLQKKTSALYTTFDQNLFFIIDNNEAERNVLNPVTGTGTLRVSFTLLRGCLLPGESSSCLISVGWPTPLPPQCPWSL